MTNFLIMIETEKFEGPRAGTAEFCQIFDERANFELFPLMHLWLAPIFRRSLVRGMCTSLNFNIIFIFYLIFKNYLSR